MATKHDFHKVIIGRSELLTFVGTAPVKIPAKTDTGAYRSAVHADNIVLNDDGVLSFDLLGGHPVCGTMAYRVTAEEFATVWVSNSFGHREQRYEVKLKVKLGPKVFHARFTLADRSKKIYPVLLGRKLLNHRFLVDSAETSLNRIELKQQYNIDFPNDEEEGRDS
ncbi:ATP-dependent zinc protease [Candidatus Mycosynbacter amalyticus]|uniref:ATP-dependent zinc protease n=1 Tax=Candidatus Mycosynbacter amalyticus TaxID=2665156 RepID=A0A857MNK6_9BACT|nr:RimK/LysX family protein [Candidatus Mycosynbacter amalyticus]QHN43172.1 ATP-dependent zinc protease [Candidatus Mycosynbacter amalyticus]